jgi:hypothetical protein
MQDIYGNPMRAICEKHALKFATALAEIEIPARSFTIKGAVNRRLTLMLPRDLYQALERDTVELSRVIEQLDQEIQEADRNNNVYQDFIEPAVTSSVACTAHFDVPPLSETNEGIVRVMVKSEYGQWRYDGLRHWRVFPS